MSTKVVNIDEPKTEITYRDEQLVFPTEGVFRVLEAEYTKTFPIVIERLKKAGGVTGSYGNTRIFTEEFPFWRKLEVSVDGAYNLELKFPLENQVAPVSHFTKKETAIGDIKSDLLPPEGQFYELMTRDRREPTEKNALGSDRSNLSDVFSDEVIRNMRWMDQNEEYIRGNFSGRYVVVNEERVVGDFDNFNSARRYSNAFPNSFISKVDPSDLGKVDSPDYFVGIANADVLDL